MQKNTLAGRPRSEVAMNLLAVLSAVVWVPVTSQLFPQTGSGEFPSSFGSSFSLPKSGSQFAPPAFLSGQSFSLTKGDTQRPFRPQQPPPTFTPTATTAGKGNGGEQKKHTYADGTMGGDYPSHKAAKQKQQQQQQGGPNTGFASGQQARTHSQFNNDPPTQQTHTYADGTTGGDYPSKMAAKQAQQQHQQRQQQQQQQPFPVAQSLNSHLAAATNDRNSLVKKNPGQVPHTYPDGTKGHDYPSKKAQQQRQQQQHLQQQQQQPAVQFGRGLPAQVLQPGKEVRKNPNQATHTYADGTTGGDYPSKMAAQKQQQQRQQPVAQFGGSFPTQFQVPQVRDDVKHNPNQVQHTYADGTKGGDYPSKMAAQQHRQQQQQQQQPTVQFGGSFPTQFQVPQVRDDVKHNPNQVQHTYADGTKGGDYPSKMAAQKQQQQKQPTVQFGGSFPTRFQVPQGRNNPNQGLPSPNQGQHTYADGTKGGDYPSKMAAQKQQQQQQPNVQFGGSFPTQFQAPQVGKNPTQGFPNSNQGSQHTYADGTTGGDYPSKMAAQKQQQQQQQQQPTVQFGGGFPTQFQVPQVGKNSNQGLPNSNQGQHTYADGTTGGDYPSKMAAQKHQNKAGGASGGAFPSRLANQQGQFGSSFGPQGSSALTAGTVPQQFPVPVSPNKVPFSTQQFSPVQASAGNFRGSSVFPPVQVPGNNPAFLGSLPQGSNPKTSTLSQSFVPNGVPQGGSSSGQHTYADGTTGENYPDHKAKQQQAGGRPLAGVPQTFPGGTFQPKSPLGGSTSSGQHTYADGTTGENYPDHKAKQQQAGGRPPLGVPQTFPGGGVRGTGTGNSFLPSSQLSPRGGAQCFRYQDLAASYKLSDVDNNYPTDSIMSELRSNAHLLPMVGYESLPETKDSGSLFGDFGESFSLSSSFSSLSFPGKKETSKVSNVKYFPANFDKDTLGQAMAPVDTACPSQSSPLRALTIDGNRCSVVNADFQDITFAKCLRRDCGQCGGAGSRGGGVSACVERYSWVTVMVHCPHWQRGQRVNAVRVYLPQGCSCNRYQC